MATAVSLASLAFSAVSQRRARKDQEKAAKVDSKKASLENARARRKNIAAARRQRAATIAQGNAAGIGGGSQVAGAVGSLDTQSTSNTSFLNQLEGFNNASYKHLESANVNLGNAATGQAVGSFANSPIGQEAINKGVSFFKGS